MGTHNQKITPMVNTKWEATKKAPYKSLSVPYRYKLQHHLSYAYGRKFAKTIMRYVYDYLRGGNGENTHRYLLRTAGAFSASLYDLCKENKQRAEGGPLQELAFSMVTPLSGPRPAWWS